MQNVLIKIIGQPHFHPSLTVDIGPGYQFLWNEAVQAYTYAPTTQAQIDDIFLSKNLHNGVWDFAPHFTDGPYVAAGATEAAPAPVAAADIAFYQSEIATRDEQIKVATARIAELKAGMLTLKGETEKAIAAATAALKSAPAPKPAEKPHWKTVKKEAAARTKAAAATVAQPTATDDDLPTD